jgi:hypothetical protein
MSQARSSAPTAAPARGFVARAVHAAREWLTLAEARRTVEGYGEAQAARVRTLVSAASTRLDAADAISEPQRAAAAMALYRDGAVMLVAAALVARDGSAEVDGLDAAGARDRLGDLGPVPDFVRAAFDVFSDRSLLALDGDDAEAVATRRQEAEDAAWWLRGRVEARTLERLFVSRVLRAVGIALVLFFGGRMGFQALFAPKNLALNKIVIASSRYPGTPDPQALVDGDRSASYGVHTQIESEPWVQIDLGGPSRVRRVRVWNRTDGYTDESLPLVLETADAPQGPWMERARKVGSFTDSPWDVELGGASVTRIRLRVAKNGYLSLGEVEVFGE